MVSSVLAFILLAAALAKAYQLTTELVDWRAMTGREYLLLLWAVAEFSLGVFLASGRYPRLARLITGLVFTVFAGVSLYQALSGVPTCGCFGKLPVSPWLTLVVDVIALACLIAFRPAAAPLKPLLGGLPAVGGACLIVAVVATTLGLWFGSLQAAMAYLSGEPVSAYPTVSLIGTGERGSWRELTVTVVNQDTSPVLLLGANQSCEFYIAEAMPLELSPGERRELRCVARYVPADNGARFRRSLVLYTSSKSTPPLYLEVRGEVR